MNFFCQKKKHHVSRSCLAVVNWDVSVSGEELSQNTRLLKHLSVVCPSSSFLRRLLPLSPLCFYPSFAFYKKPTTFRFPITTPISFISFIKAPPSRESLLKRMCNFSFFLRKTFIPLIPFAMIWGKVFIFRHF